MIYRIHEDNANFQNFFLDLEEVLDVMDETIGEREFLGFSVDNISLKDLWPGFKAEFKKKERKGKILPRPDMATWRGANLVLSQKAYDVLAKSLESYGEFLPLTCDDEPCYIFNCLTLGEIDEVNSKKEMLDGYPVGVERLVFDEERLGDKLVFKTPYERCISVLCQNEFKDMVERAELTGLRFDAHLEEII